MISNFVKTNRTSDGNSQDVTSCILNVSIQYWLKRIYRINLVKNKKKTKPKIVSIKIK